MGGVGGALRWGGGPSRGLQLGFALVLGLWVWAWVGVGAGSILRGGVPLPGLLRGGGVLSPGVSLCSAGGILESFMLESFRLAILGIKLPFTCGESSLY